MSNPEQPQLMIDVNSWHYRHYCRIRKLYGFDTQTEKITSVCPYVQTMIWGSLFFILSLPFQIVGWIGLKVCRLLYRCFQATGCDRFVDWIDKTLIGDALDKSSDHLKVAPVIALLGWCLAVASSGVIIAAVAILLGGGIWGLILAIPHIPWALWLAITTVGWATVWCFWALVNVVVFFFWCLGAAFLWFFDQIIWLFSQVFLGLVWLFTAGWLWLGIVKWAAIVVLATLICFGITYIVLQFFNTKAGKGLLDWLSMKFNGYKEAREEAERRRAMPPPEVEEGVPAPPKPPFFLKRWWRAIDKWVDARCESLSNFFVSRDFNVGGKAVKVLSFFGAFGLFVWALKHRMCPIVSFVDADDIAEQADDEVTPAPESAGTDATVSDSGQPAEDSGGDSSA